MTTGYPEDWDRRRKRVLERDHYQCLACGATGGPRGETELHVDHVRPKAHGGGHDLGNLQTLCRECHGEKHGFEIGDDASEREEEEERERPVGLRRRLKRACQTTALSAALGATQVLAVWALAVAPSTGRAGIATMVVAGLIVVGVTVGVEWRPGHLPGFLVGVCASVFIVYLSGGVALADLLSDPTVLSEAVRYHFGPATPT